jgi:hypothetical protein
MPELDKLIAAAFLVGTAGVVLVRALRAWMRFRLQERTLRILTKGLTELERPRERPRT